MLKKLIDKITIGDNLGILKNYSGRLYRRVLR